MNKNHLRIKSKIFIVFFGLLIGFSLIGSNLPKHDLSINVFDSFSGDVGVNIWSFPASQLYSTHVIGDFDLDGTMEIVFKTQNPDTTGSLICISGSNGALRWNVSIGYSNNILPLIAANIDSDINLEIITQDSNYKIIVFNSFNGSVKWQTTSGFQALAVGDVDGDGNNDVISTKSDGSIIAFNGNGVIIYSTKDSTYSYNSPHLLALSDVDGDGNLEILGISSDFKRIFCLSGLNGAREWISPQFSSPCFTSPTPLDINHDGKTEIIIGTDDGNLILLNGNTGEILWSKNLHYNVALFIPNWELYSFLIGDVDQDNDYDVLFPSGNGTYVCFNSTGDLKWVYNCSVVPNSVGSLADIDGDHEIEVMFAANGSIICLNAKTGQKEWALQGASVYNSGLVETADVDGDGKLEIISSFTSHPTLSCLIGLGDPWMLPSPLPCIGGSRYHTGDFSDFDKDLIPNQLEKSMGTNPSLNDTDSDNVTDYQEIIHTINPLLNDTDNDTMIDGWELMYHFNPLNASDAELDADEDHFSNKQEFIAGTNPLKSDTDGDYWPDGWDLNPLDVMKPNLYVGVGLVVIFGLSIMRSRSKHSKNENNTKKVNVKDSKAKSKKSNR